MYMYITNKGINNQLQTRCSMTNANKYSIKNIYIYPSERAKNTDKT